MAGSLRERLVMLLQQFQISPDNITETLKEVNILLSSVSQSDISDVINDLQLPSIFRYLNTLTFQKREDEETVIEFLTKLLDSVSPQIIIEQFSPELILSLQHQSTKVKEMGLKQVKRCISDNNAASNMIRNTDLICSVIRLIGEDMCLAKISISILVEIGKDVDAINVLFSPIVNNVFNELTLQGDTIRYRVFEVFIKIACYSSWALEKVVDTGCLQHLFVELQKDDILLVLNCVELLTTLALVTHGLEYLQRQGILNKLQDILIVAITDYSGVFIIPGLLKFFGNLGHMIPNKLFVELPKVLDIMFSLTENRDDILKSHAIRSIGYISASMEGKKQLNLQGEKMESYLKSVKSLITHETMEMQIDGLATLFDLLQITHVEETKEELEVITESWCKTILSDPMTSLLTYCKSPFLNLRCGAFSILQNMASQLWGVKQMASFPGFVEYLLDRSTEQDKEGKEAKFGLVEALVKSPFTTTIFDEEVVSQMNEYYRMGPFYIQTEASVVYEGAT